MIADGDESTFRQVVEHILSVNAELDMEFLEEKAAHEFRSGSVAAFGMNSVDFVNGEEMQKPVDELFVAVKFRDHPAYIIIVEYVGAYFVVLIFSHLYNRYICLRIG